MRDACFFALSTLIIPGSLYKLERICVDKEYVQI